MPTTTIEAEVVTDLPSTHSAEPLHNLYHRCAQTAAAQATGYAILCGLELQRIKAEVSSKGGRPKKLPHSGEGVSGSWEKWVDSNCDFGLTTASKYIAVADGIKGRLAQDGMAGKLSNLVDVAPSALDQTQRETLLKSVSKVATSAEDRCDPLILGLLSPL